MDVASGDVLLDLDAGDPAIPASTAKLLTAAAALTTLDPADTLETTVVAGASPGEVVLVGGGDPTLSRTAPSQTYPGAATVADLATQVVAAMPAGTPVTRVVVDSSLFSGPLTARGWGAADAPSSYAAPVTATAVDGARVSPGSQARSGQPGLDAGSALADALGAPGAAVVLGEAPAGAETLATVRSAPMAPAGRADAVDVGQHARRGAGPPGRARQELPPASRAPPQAVTEALSEAGHRHHRGRAGRRQRPLPSDRVPAGVLTEVVAGAADGSLEGARRCSPASRWPATTARCSTAGTPAPRPARSAPRPARCWACTPSPGPS